MEAEAHPENFEVSEYLELFSDKFRRCLKSRAEPFLKEHGLRVHHLIFISTIGRNEGISQKDIKSFVPYDKSRISMVITELIFMGLVKDENIGKSSSLHLTGKGKGIYKEAEIFIRAFKDDLKVGLTEEEIVTLKTLLRKINGNMDIMLMDQN